MFCWDSFYSACHCPGHTPCLPLWGDLISHGSWYCLSPFDKVQTSCDSHHSPWILENFSFLGVSKAISGYDDLLEGSVRFSIYSFLQWEYTREAWKRERYRGSSPKTARHWVPRVLSFGISAWVLYWRIIEKCEFSARDSFLYTKTFWGDLVMQPFSVLLQNPRLTKESQRSS